MMVIQRLGVVSFGKLLGTLYAMLGLIIGAIFTLISLLGAFAQQGGRGGPMAALVGVGAIILIPLFYGVIGFLAGLLTSALYNLAASIVGGVELELVPQQPGH